MCEEPSGHTDVSTSRMNSFDVLVFIDMTQGPKLYLGTCNYVELGGMLKCNISCVCVCVCAHPRVYLSVSKLNSLALSFSCFSCFQQQILLGIRLQKPVYCCRK